MATAVKQPKEQQVASKEAIKDYESMDLQDLAAMRDALDKAIAQKAAKEFEADINFIVARAKNQRVKLSTYVQALIGLMDEEDRVNLSTIVQPARPTATRAPRGTAPKKTSTSQDSTGATPIPGKTYVLNGAEWTKNATGKGQAKKEFLDAVKAGATWASLEKQ